MDTRTLIEMQDVAFHAEHHGHTHTILHDITLRIKAGEILTLIGPNGAGKTTLVKLVLGLVQATRGRIIHASPLTFGYVPQKLNLQHFLPLRVSDFLELGADHKDAFKNEIRTHGVAFFHLEKVLNSQMHTLSGGELQKVLLIYAALQKPSMLVLDEPAQGVDIMTQERLYGYIDHIRQKTQCAVLLVSHNIHLVMAKSDAVICLNKHICCMGSPCDIQKHPEYLSIFEGTVPRHVAPYHHHTHEE